MKIAMTRIVLSGIALSTAICRAQQPCENLTKLSLANISITMAVPVAAGSFNLPGGRGGAAPANVPAFCRVAGVIAPEIKFELWMPAQWNHKFMEVGNGG